MTGLVRLAFAAFFFFYFTYIGLMSPYASLYFASLRYNAIEIAALMSMFQITRILGPFAWGWLADIRRDRLGIMRLTSLLACLIFSAIFYLESYWALLVWMFLLNTVISSLMPLGEAATIHALYKDKTFDQRYGRLRLWGSVGFIVMVMGAGAWFEAYGIQSLPWFGMAALIILAVLTRTLHEPPMDEVAHHSATSFWHVLKNKQVKWFLSASFWMIFGHAALYVFYSLYLDRLGYSKAEIGLFWMLGVLAEVVFFYFQNSFFKRFTARQILMASYLIMALRFVMIAYWPNTFVLIIAQVMHAATFGAHHSASLKMLQTWFAGHLQARGQALYTTVAYGIGGTVGGLAAGWVWESLGAEHVFGLAALSGLLGYWCIKRVRV
jgi:PPP family 3-phenylpropionic acid transporter